MRMVNIDQEALTTFIEKMRRIADAIGDGRDSGAFSYAGMYPGGPVPDKWEGGVKVTLGVTEYDHVGRAAGQKMAEVIGATMESLISIEEGARAMAEIGTAIRNGLNEQDCINFDELTDILRYTRMGPFADSGKEE